ncbi:hypothetical protein CDL15_Pgr012890 [Punica granatum]|uniref:Glycolipid transfer protein domain-containing protein n=1 Tax=Punica granatum TaxID=22663 RepID=A0A218XFD8_PUNGR|nr:hypothetical protein CDL15_Pgr012890 [Punica granatum]
MKTQGSHTRNLRRVRQGLDLIKALIEQFLSSNDYSLKDAATTAYSPVCAPYHTWAVRTAVYAGLVRQGLDLIKALFEQFLSSNDYSLKDAATTAYSPVCAPYHTWAVRTAVYAGLVRQGLDLIKALFEQFLSSNDYSLKDAATTAYSPVCAPYHTWAVRTAVYAGLDYSLKDAATTAYSLVCAPYHTWAVRTAVYAGLYAFPVFYYYFLIFITIFLYCILFY